jgi:hypothetical protein
MARRHGAGAVNAPVRCYVRTLTEACPLKELTLRVAQNNDGRRDHNRMSAVTQLGLGSPPD